MSRILSLAFNHYLEAVLAAALLISPAAYAGPSRDLSLATAEAPPPNASESADTPQAPPADLRASDRESKAPAVTEPPTDAKASTHHKFGLQARMIHELHRYGIYW
jgi:hypothetical protein